MEDPYSSLYQIGDRLIIELNSEQIFEGDYSGGGKNRLDLNNVRQRNNINELGGGYSFYRNEIIKIYRQKSEVLDKREKNKISVSKCDNIQIVEEEYNRLKHLCKNVIYLEQVDDKYFKSIEKLSEAETIALTTLGANENTTDILTLLVICTWQQIYIFDLIHLKNRKFYPAIKDLLESEYVTKVMHGGSPLINMLYRSYNVCVRNIFDTQIVDLILVKSSTGMCPNTLTDISQCLVNNLNFPPSILKEALSAAKENWIERPLTEEKRFLASQLVVYLIPLKEQMKKKLLTSVYKAIDEVHSLYFNLGNYEFSQMVKNSKVTKEIDNVIPMLSNKLNLNENNPQQM